MAVWRIEIDDSNTAFDNDAPASEMARILRNLAQTFEDEGGPDCEYTSQPLRDINGNTVGFVTYDMEA